MLLLLIEKTHITIIVVLDDDLVFRTQNRLLPMMIALFILFIVIELFNADLGIPAGWLIGAEASCRLS